MLLLWIPIRQRPGFGTLANAVVIGLATDASLAVLPVAPDRRPSAIIAMLLSVPLNALAGALYIGAGLGPGPRDGLMTGLVARGVGPVMVVRTGLEGSVLLGGWLLGGPVGIGTVVYALGIGPLLQPLMPLFAVDKPSAADDPARRSAGSDVPGMTLTFGVLALQGDVREHLDAVERLGHRGAPGPPRRRAGPRSTALIIPGGESTTMSRLLDVFALREPLAARLADGLPAYGSCAGMIMLATTIVDGRPDQRPLGALDITVRRNAFGRQVDSFEGEVEVAGIDGAGARGVHPRPVGGGGRDRGRGARDGRRPSGRGPPGAGAGHLVPPRDQR